MILVPQLLDAWCRLLFCFFNWSICLHY